MKIIKRDITSVTNGLVIHGVNCQNRFGSGVAGAISKKWPDIKENYHNHCKLYPKSELLGTYQANLEYADEFEQLIIINLFSQFNFGYDGSRYADLSAINKGLRSIINDFKEQMNLNLPIYLPKIGCGLGGLSWKTEVEPLLNNLESEFNKEFIICEWP